MGTAGPGRPSTFVVVEGPNGAGKTTVVRGLAAVFGMTALGFPSGFLRYREEVRLDGSASPLARLLHYLGAVVQISDEVLATRGAVVCDRYWASPLAAIEAEGALPVAEVDRLGAPVLDHLARPALTVMLTARPAVLAARVGQRDAIRSSFSAVGVLGSEAFAQRWTDRLRLRVRQSGPMVEIDTSESSSSAVIAAAVGYVRSLAVAGDAWCEAPQSS